MKSMSGLCDSLNFKMNGVVLLSSIKNRYIVINTSLSVCLFKQVIEFPYSHRLGSFSNLLTFVSGVRMVHF